MCRDHATPETEALARAPCGATAAPNTREPVLKQVDLPHSYYWRELYLPQLTAGPTSACFLREGDTLVYSMAGSLWRQHIGDNTATELTHPASAYDYQPDASPDSRSVVFARYDGDAIELWRLDLVSGVEQQLSTGGAVNVEPRLSPDGTRLAWVSTQGSGHFNLFVAGLDAEGLHDVRALLGERRSGTDRHYYSAFDHAINPSWSPDGAAIYYVGNPEIAWGTGDIFAVEVADPAKRRRVLSEETNWCARPEVAPDGRRLLYASYRGRQHAQLWLTTATGAAPLPLTFGDFDRRSARWSPDGSCVAFIDNRDGDTALRVLHLPGGAIADVIARQRTHKLPQARLTLDIVDSEGRPTPARVSVLGSDGRAHAPRGAWMCGDDGFDRRVQPIETHYFHCGSSCTLDLPAGATSIWVQHGFAHAPWRKAVELAAGQHARLTATLTPDRLPDVYGDFVSADLHIHMNYGGHYRNTPARLAEQARAEDLNVAWNLVVNKEERMPDLAAFRADRDPASGPSTLVLHAQEYHSSFWGHLGVLNLADHVLTPGFAAYQHTAMASPYPTNAAIADLARAQSGLVGYAHPFDVLPDPDHDPMLSHELPAGVIMGKVDYIEVMGFSDHKATAVVWYRLLNLGFRLPAGAGSDTMANYASLRGPVGMNRVFLDTGGQCEVPAVLDALQGGRGFASNGPLLGLLLDGARPGDEVQPGHHRYRVALRSAVAIDHVELVHNGEVVKAFVLAGDRRRLDAEGELDLAGGWVLLRAWNDHADPDVLDLYPYATTNPVWLGSRVLATSARADAAWFAKWVARIIEAAGAREDYNTAEEKHLTLDYLARARDAYLALAKGHAPAAQQGTTR